MLKQTPVELRQALVIGLGEAGKEVVEQLHLLLKERLEPKADALLDARLSALLDKDLGPVPVIGLMTLEPEYGAETGKLQGGREDGIFRVLLPLDPRWAVGSYEADTEGEGLGHSAVPAFSSDLDIDLSQTRRIGRAAMRAYANQLQDLINDVQGDIRTMDRLDAVRTRKDHNIRVDEPNLEVFLLAALDEPFASGAFLDLAYLVDHVLHFERSDRFNYYTSGILFLPNYTQEGDMGLREADTYAALKELDYYITQRRRYESGYGHRLQFTSMEAPFNRSCYLVEAANEKGRALPDLGQLAAMVSEWLYRYLTTPLSGHFRTHGSEFAWRKSAERVTAYSGLGTASFILSIDEVIEVCAARLGEEMVRDGFRRELAGKERAGPQGRAQAFAGDPISITAERAIQSGRTGEYQDISAKHFENITLWDFRAVRRRVLELFGSRLVHMLPIMKREIQDRVEGALDQVQRALSQEVERLINELPIGGVDRVQIFLERLRGEMASREKDARELAAYSHKQEKEDGTRIAEARAKYRSAVETVEWPAPIWLLVSVIVILAFLGYGLKILWQGLPYLELSVLGGQFIEFHNTHLLAGIVLLLGNLSILGLVGWYGYTWMEGAQGTYISWHVNRLRHSLDKVCYELRGRFFQAMQEVVNEQLVAVTDFRDLLDDLASELEKFRAKPRPLYGTPRFPLEESVLKPEDLKGFYQEVTKAEEGGLEDVIARLMREHGPFYDWRDREPEDLRDMIVAFGKTQMEKLRNRKSAEALLIKHLEAPSAPDQVRLDALAERAPAVVRDEAGQTIMAVIPPLSREQREALRKRVDELLQRSHPFLRYSATRLEAGVEAELTTLLGVATAGSEDTPLNRVVNEQYSDVQRVTTRDPHTIVAMTARHGLPLYVLGNIDRYQANYYRHFRDKPLHTRPMHMGLPDLIPRRTEDDIAEILEPMMAFAIGQALKKRGARQPLVDWEDAQGYFFVYEQDLGRKVTVPLGHDKLDACVYLGQHADDLGRLSKQIDEVVVDRATRSRKGNEVVIRALQRYLDDNEGRLEDWEVVMIQEYIRKLW